MARIEWAVVSDLAFLDRDARLCVVGIATGLIVQTLPVSLQEIMVVARVVDQLPGEEIDVGVAVVTPTGMWSAPDDPESVDIEVAGEYVVATFRDLPLTEDGTYRFAMCLDQQPPVVVDVPVSVVPKRCHAEVH